jgi:DNA-binding NtrC family response regulator
VRAARYGDDMDMSRTDLTGAKVLLVDDEPEVLEVLVGMLCSEAYDIRVALSGTVALDLARRFTPDLILLDVAMAEMDGLETCRQLHADPAIADIPVVFLTARTAQTDVIAGFEAGGIDYIPKPVNEKELCMRVAMQLRMRRLVQELVQKNEDLEAEIARREALSKERDHLSGRMSLISAEETKRWGIAGFVGNSQTLKKILGDIERLRQVSTTSVLITGESGTGKELVARALHFGSARGDGPFMPVNCSSISGELADSLLFGHVKGAFTGADQDRLGYFELADGGTLFLDEIGDMPPQLQAKLLRVLEERAVLPVGGTEERAVDVRVVAATNVSLEAEIGKGRFRQDLYYRLAGFPVEVPPLRERREDIPLLASHFVELFATEMGVPAPAISAAAQSVLAEYAYPGNVRELKNAIERALIESGGSTIEAQHLHLTADVASSTAALTGISVDDLPLNMARAERALMQRAMAQANGNLAKAARMLGINRMRIYRSLAAEEEDSD